ncbi:SRPBCC family protein [Micromonospora musae]|uniref:SRPBCC family protein n=1 Tax=Micromonospora musae TaxID=1894970 RepID=UPI0033CFF4C0
MAHAERGMSAPPEVVFNTATDPDRAAAWLPPFLRADGAPTPEIRGEELRARWRIASPTELTAEIRVDPENAGGARIRFDLSGGSGGQDTDRLAAEALDSLAREVADNLQAG